MRLIAPFDAKNTVIYMKIIKKGQHPSQTIHKAKCGGCKTEIEFIQSEARTVTDRNEVCLVVVCPVCGRDIWKTKAS